MSNHTQELSWFNELRITKFHIPNVGAETIQRTRLFEALNQIENKRLVVVEAPAGYGKSTIVSQWIKYSQPVVGWLSMGREDQSVVGFVRNLLGTIYTIDPSLVQGMETFVISANPDLELLMSRLTNRIEKFNDHLVVVLDDYHLVKSHEVDVVIKLMLDQFPTNFHLIITTREAIQLPISKLRVNRQLVELTKQDLRFSRDEIQKFLLVFANMNFTDEQLDLIETKTEGWIVSIQLLVLSGERLKSTISSQHFRASEKFLKDYIKEEIISHLKPATKEFVLASSLMSRFNHELMDYVVGIANSQELIDGLLNANMFIIPLDDSDEWYRYHHLFAELLRQKFQQEQPKKLNELYGKAAYWNFENGDVVDAMNYAFNSGDLALVNRLIEESMLELILNGELNTLFTWFDRLSIENVTSSMVKVWLAWIYIFSEQMDMKSIAYFLDEIEEELQIRHDQVLKYPTIHIHILAIRGFIASHTGDIETGIKNCVEALQQFPDSELFLRGTIAYNIVVSYFMAGQNREATQYYDVAIYESLKGRSLYGAITSIFYKGLGEISEGRLHEAEKTFNGAISLTQEHHAQDFGFNGYNYVGLGKVYYLWNRFDKAEECLKKGVELGLAGAETMSSLYGLMFLSKLYAAKGERIKALHTINKAKEFASSLSVTFRKLEVEAIQAEIFIMIGEMQATKDWARPYLKIVHQEFSVLSELQATVVAWFLIKTNDMAIANPILEWLEYNQKLRGRSGELLKTLLLKSIALHKSMEKEAALITLANAVKVAETEGCILPFLQEHTMVNGMIEEFKAEGKGGDLTFVISHFDRLKETGIKPANTFNLSTREQEVLILLEEGKSNREIASQLFISLGTVKRHVHNIFAKMEVNDRSEAINKSKALIM